MSSIVSLPTEVPDFQEIIDNNPSGYILRKNLKPETGGLLDGRTMANKDSKNEGIKGRIMLGRKVAYPVREVVKYLQNNVVVK